MIRFLATLNISLNNSGGGDHAIPTPGIAPVLCGSKTVGSLVGFLTIRGIGQDQINGLIRKGLQANQTILIENGIKFHGFHPFVSLMLVHNLSADHKQLH